MTTVTEKLQELLTEKFAEPEFAHLFVTEIQTLPQGIVHIFMDSDTGVSLDHCVVISRFLEEKLDENGWLGDDYTLEVSSPGIDTPLRDRRQYPKNIGREVSVKTKDDYKNVKGTLKTVSDNGVMVEYEERIPIEGKPKAKKRITVQKELAWDNIEYTTVKISFK